MKKITTIITLIVVVCFVYQQADGTTTPKQEKYVRQDGLNKFVGQWEFSADGKYFKVTLRKEKKGNSGSFTDFIVGSHFYSENNIVNQSSEGKSQTSINVGMFDQNKPNDRLIKFRFNDLKKGISGKGTMELRDNNTLIWKISFDGVNLAVDGKKVKDTNFAVPAYAVLTRKK